MDINVDQKALKIRKQKEKEFDSKGTRTGLFSGFTFGLNSFFLALAFTLIPEELGKTIYVLPLVGAALNDTFAAIWLLIYNIAQGRGKEIKRSFKTFPGKMIALGALLGGPIAQGGYLLAIAFAGPAYAVPISALCPAIGALLSWIFLKEKITPRVWGGLLLSVIGAIVISYTPPTGDTYPNFYLGIIAAIVAAVGWGAEGVLGAFGSSVLDPKVAISIRDIVSGLAFMVVVVPIVKGFGAMKEILAMPKAVMYFAVAAAMAATSFLSWYKANSTCGVAKGMALNSTYVAWGVILPIIFLGEKATTNLIIGSILVLLGAVLVSIDPKELFKKEA